jgi:hypothetical protein
MVPFVTNKLINSTVELIIQYPEFDINVSKVTRKADPSNFWNMLCLKYASKIDYHLALKMCKSWSRNTNGFANQVNQLTNNKVNKKEENENSFTILITNSEWMSLNSSIINNSERGRFKKEFSDFLSEKLQLAGVNCWIRCNFNWFKKNLSQKSSSPFWSGNYTCVDPNCRNIFKCEIINPIQDKCVIIFVQMVKKSNHKSKITNKVVCSGKKREKQALDLMMQSSLNCKTENLIQNALHDKGKL